MKKTDFIIYNGEKHIITEKIFSINNRAFRFGDGFFESIFSYYDNIPFWGIHYLRIINAIKDYGFKKPNIFSQQYFLNEMERLRNANKFHGAIYTRISFFREGMGRYYPTEDADISYVIEQTFLGQSKFKINEEGLIIGDFAEYKKPINKWSRYKKLSADLFVFASIYAHNNNYDDVLIFNEKGNIVETTNSNIFCVGKDDIIYTPSVASGCVDGVMRKVVIEIFRNNGVELKEVDDFNESYINNADELFVTNAVKGVRWVAAYKNKRFLRDTTEFLINRINEIYF